MKYEEWSEIKKENKNDGRINWNDRNLKMNQKMNERMNEKIEKNKVKGKNWKKNYENRRMK